MWICAILSGLMVGGTAGIEGGTLGWSMVAWWASKKKKWELDGLACPRVGERCVAKTPRTLPGRGEFIVGRPRPGLRCESRPFGPEE